MKNNVVFMFVRLTISDGIVLLSSVLKKFCLCISRIRLVDISWQMLKVIKITPAV